jgi:hypothetical protein
VETEADKAIVKSSAIFQSLDSVISIALNIQTIRKDLPFMGMCFVNMSLLLLLLLLLLLSNYTRIWCSLGSHDNCGM